MRVALHDRWRGGSLRWEKEAAWLVGRASVAPSGPECVAHRALTPIDAGIKRTAATLTGTSIAGLTRTEEDDGCAAPSAGDGGC